jgi:bifunctional DNase/RNase
MVRWMGVCFVAGVLALSASWRAEARELAVPASDLVPAELVGVLGLADSGIAVMVFRVGDEELPVFVGVAEAEAIERARRGLRPPRPLTHELFGDVLVATGWTIERLVIDALRDGQFMAALELRNAESGLRRRVDSRPSDGMALALRSDAPVYVARQVIEAAAEESEEAPGRREPRGMLTAMR